MSILRVRVLSHPSSEGLSGSGVRSVCAERPALTPTPRPRAIRAACSRSGVVLRGHKWQLTYLGADTASPKDVGWSRSAVAARRPNAAKLGAEALERDPVTAADRIVAARRETPTVTCPSRGATISVGRRRLVKPLRPLVPRS